MSHCIDRKEGYVQLQKCHTTNNTKPLRARHHWMYRSNAQCARLLPTDEPLCMLYVAILATSAPPCALLMQRYYDVSSVSTPFSYIIVYCGYTGTVECCQSRGAFIFLPFVLSSTLWKLGRFSDCIKKLKRSGLFLLYLKFSTLELFPITDGSQQIIQESSKYVIT